MKIKTMLFALGSLFCLGSSSMAFSASNNNNSDSQVNNICNIIVSADPAEGAYVSGGGKYKVNGNSINISTSANNTPDFTYTFKYWSMNGEKTAYSQDFLFTPTKGTFEFVAHYEKEEVGFDPDNPSEPSSSINTNRYYLYLTSNIKGACSFNMDSGNKINEKVQLDICAKLNQGYHFEGWKHKGQIISTDQNLSFIMPGEDTTLEAVVSEKPVDPEDPVDYNASCGENLNSNYVETTKTLTISGTGTMTDFSSDKPTPWDTYKTSIQYLIIQEGATSIGNFAFNGCSGLTSVTIPSSVKSIGKQAFASCQGLTNVVCYSKPIPLTSTDAYEGSNIENATLQVPETLIEEYQTTFPWKGFKSITAIPDYTFTLTYMVDGVVYKKYRVDKDDTITPEPEPTKEGYTFSGWSEIPATMPANDVTVTGTFTVNKYKLTYKVDGKEYKTYEIEFGKSITPEKAPKKEGYTFSGWSEIPATMPANDVTVTGTFNVNTYKLTYKVDGEVYTAYDIKYGEQITPEPEPTKEGFTFSGWSDIPEKMPANDVTVTGTFSAKNKYKLTYKVDGEVYKTYELEFGAEITPEEAPKKEGYTFSGWSDIPEKMPANDVTVTGTFTINTYKLTYKVDGEVYKTYDIKYGEQITPEPEPTKEGFTFSGWSEIPEKMPANDVTVTGTFSAKNKYKLTYKVDGEVYKTYELEFGAEITPEKAPTKEGYTFSGWSEIPATMPANDVTVTGTFNVNTYKLTYKVDGEVYKAYDIKYGEQITPEPEPTKEGYTFSGWSAIPEKMPANDVTVTGTFSAKNKYKLTYKVDGEVYKTYELEFGAEITPEEAPTKEGYTFSGWSEIPATMPANDVTVTGTFNVNTYKLTYKVDGEVYKAYDIKYGEQITPEPEPKKEGFTFSGWSDIPEKMPANDVTVTGTFSAKNKYKLTYKVDGEVYKTYELEFGAEITPEEAPKKEGYTFSGWSEIPATMPAHDITVTGTFTAINKYRLTYIVDDVEYKTYELELGETITPEPEPTKEDRTFSGWSEIPATMPDHDVTVTGFFTYKLKYVVDGEEYKTIEIYYSAEIIPEPVPTKEGYTFSGWSEIPATMPAEDVTVTGTFTINEDEQTEVDGVVSILRTDDVSVQSIGNKVIVTGASEGTEIVIYNLAGQVVGSAKATSEATNIPISLQSKEVGIVMIGERSMKVLMK